VKKLFALTILCLALASPALSQKEEVDLLLVLAADVSRSVDDAKFRLQRQGYATALENPTVLHSIAAGRHKKIAVSYIEWSGVVSQKTIVDWSIIDGHRAAHEFGTKLIEHSRPFADRTSISAAIDFSMERIENSPYTADRKTIDISGDGTNNSGRDIASARDRAARLGIVINGLVILSQTHTPWNQEHTNPPGGLTKYYRDNVATPEGFVLAAAGHETFALTLIKKMVAEIALLQR
jgi:hypothetical protein